MQVLPERGVPRVQATSESDTAAHVRTVLALLVGAANHVASVPAAADYHIGRHTPDGSQLVTALEGSGRVTTYNFPEVATENSTVYEWFPISP